mgnify:CR=1 FL=1
MVGVIISLLVTIMVVVILLKKMKAQFVLFFGGLTLLVCSIAMDAFGLLPNGAQILPKGVASTGFIGFDLFKCITSLMSSRTAGIGLLIMSAAGYSKYMSMIGASAIMADYLCRPLRIFRSPYFVLSLAYIIGAIADLFIPSASGLAMLLMVTIYPVLVRLGARLPAAAVIATVSCLDMGPTSGAANYAAQVAGMDTITYFVEYQIPVGIVVTIAVAALHFFTQRYFDAKDGDKANEVDEATAKQEKIDVKGAPAWYGLLPMIPLVLLIVFNRFVIDTVKLDVPTAMFISFTVALCCELARKAVKDVLNTGFEFFNMMGRQFATVITLIVAGELFAKGLIATGTIDYLIAGTQNLGLPAYAIMIVVVSFISISCVVMGSGNAPFFAFAPLVPDFAQQFGVSTILLLMPMQLSTGLARVMSPITAVVVAVAGCSGISPFALVRRTAIPMTGGLCHDHHPELSRNLEIHRFETHRFPLKAAGFSCRLLFFSADALYGAPAFF